jgi:mono/diheme cytochrome c family protein
MFFQASNETRAGALKAIALALPLLGLGVASNSTLAQDAAAFEEPTAEMVELGREVWKERGGCFNCHGEFGQGGEGGHFPAGPSLRRTQLDLATLREITACGIPTTRMPYNLAGAYTEHSCFGQVGEVPQGVSPGAGLSVEELDALVAYVGETILGKRTVTRAECVAYFDGNENEPTCGAFR